MYMAYGWPQVIPLEQGLCPSAQKIVYLKLINRVLLVVSPTHFELWSSSQVHGSVHFFYSIFGFLCGVLFFRENLKWVFVEMSFCNVGMLEFACEFMMWALGFVRRFNCMVEFLYKI